ncbi:hypothetical protein NST41_14325 [Paenibacillus sp. FSL L8-0696]|uniref:hypothetical protein n=1 Tax=Paenibacillus sp. FSL L8-0696 TaxID=2954524 RepID=UPI00311A7E5D
MEEIQAGQTGVEVPVAGEHQQIEQQTNSVETGVTTEVAAQGGEQEKNYGAAITAEVSRREAQLQKKYETQYGGYQKNLERVAKAYGFQDVDSYMTALDEYEQQQQIEQEARRLGVDTDVIVRFREELNPIKSELNQYKQEMQTVREEKATLAVERELADLKTRFPDFDQYKDRAFELAINDGYKLEDAYKLASYEDKIANTAKQTEAETIRKLQANAASTPGALGSEGAEHKTGFSTMSKADQRKFIEDVKAGRRNSFD